MTAQLDAVHDQRHLLDDRPHTRESLVYMVQIPEEGLSLVAYTWVNRESRAGRAVTVFGPGVGEPLVDHVDGVAVDPATGFDDWQVAGLRLAMTAPLQSAQVTFESERFSCDLSFDATHPAYLYSSGPRGCPPALSDDRIEQAGRIHGGLWWDGREVRFDRSGHRDHAWGVRDWAALGHYRWIEAQAGQSAIQCYQGDDGLDYGYVYRDGILSHIETSAFEIEFDEHLKQTALEIEIRDAERRTTQVRCEAFGHLEFEGHEGITLVEAACTTTIDGVAGEGYADFGWSLNRLRDARRAMS